MKRQPIRNSQSFLLNYPKTQHKENCNHEFIVLREELVPEGEDDSMEQVYYD
jgi:hypothetical protein